MSLKKEKIFEIEETDLNKLEDFIWIIEEFIDLNLYKCKTLKELLIWNFNIKFKKDRIFITGDHFSCSILVKDLIDKDGEITEIIERYVKKMILWHAKLNGWIEESDF